MDHSNENKSTSPRRVLNLKAVAIVVGLCVLFRITASWLHASQLERTSTYLKSAADAALAEGEPNKAFDLYEQFLALNPADQDVEETIARLLEEHGNSPRDWLRAFSINEMILHSDRTRDDLRLRQIRLAGRMNRYSDAAVHLRILRDKDSRLSEVWHFSGLVARDTGHFDEAVQYFRRATELENPLPESFEHLAKILTNELRDTDTAQRVLDQLVAKYDSAQARLIRSAWLMDQQQAAQALPDLKVALQQQPADLRTNAMLVRAIRRAADQDRRFDADSEFRSVIRHLNDLLLTSPDESRLRLYLASALWAVGERRTAIDQLRYGLERDPRQIELQEALVDYLVSMKDADAAREVFNRLPQQQLDRGRRTFLQGRLLMAQERWPEAAEAFEKSLGYAADNEQVVSRARICLALCRRESGQHDAAMDSYRALIQANPDLESGRLGIASAYLRADQVDLAIAEYRQLTHVEGVPEFLANLMIRHISNQPPVTRDWTAVEDLLRDEKPIVKDPVQRILLQADLLFGQGQPSVAMDLLDRAARRMPEREEIQRAVARLSSIHGDAINQRILKALEEDPANSDAHQSVLRLQLARGDAADMRTWLQKVSSGQLLGSLGDKQRHLLIARAATRVAESELATRGRSDQVNLLLDFAETSWRTLHDASPRRFLDYVEFQARHRGPTTALDFVDRNQSALRPRDVAQAWLTCLRFGSEDATVRQQVSQRLAKLIDRNPADSHLRIVWADALLLVEDYESAKQQLQQLERYDQHSGLPESRLAWISALIDRELQQALEYSEDAIRKAPADPVVRQIRGLALAEAGQTDIAIELLQSLTGDSPSAAAHLFHARSLQLADRSADASNVVLDLLPYTAGLAPAERNLLTHLQQQLQISPSKISRR